VSGLRFRVLGIKHGAWGKGSKIKDSGILKSFNS
jgi:hypothetical protein